jgi:phytoene dehydrogenase-like protein
MVNKQHYDVVVVGAGVGGLVTGAILAAKEGMKVIVLEKAPMIGGRTVCFGKQHGSDYSASEVREILGECLSSTIIKSEPDFDRIIEKGILKDFIIEGGYHGMTAGSRGRLAWIGRALGKHISLADLTGWAYFKDGRWLQLPEITKDWPPESQRERSRVASERLLITPEQAKKYLHVDLESYLESVTDDELVRDYYRNMGRWYFGFTDAKRLSAGEYINTQNCVVYAGQHLIGGGGVGDAIGGVKTVADVFASVIRENGGEVRTRHSVTEVIIKKWKAEGVVVKGKRGNEEISASNVVCNPPPYHLFNIIPDKYFVGDLMQRAKNMYATGAVTVNVCLKEPLEKNHPTGQFIVPVLPGAENLDIPGGAPAFGFEQNSMSDPSRAPEGRYLMQGADITVPEALRDPYHLEQQADAIIRFLRSQYPHFDDILDWYYVQACPFAYYAYTPDLAGDRRFPIRHPVIPNLFFTGDCVQEYWDNGCNGAAHAGVLCANAVSGRHDYLSLLPFYWR